MTQRGAALTALGGEVFSAQAALEHGLVTQVVADDDLDTAVTEVTTSLATGAPQGLRETKLLLGRPLVERIDTLGPDLAKLSASLFGSDEAKAAMQAFLTRKK